LNNTGPAIPPLGKLHLTILLTRFQLFLQEVASHLITFILLLAIKHHFEPEWSFCNCSVIGANSAARKGIRYGTNSTMSNGRTGSKCHTLNNSTTNTREHPFPKDQHDNRSPQIHAVMPVTRNPILGIG
jgi:hypothetical protein